MAKKTWAIVLIVLAILVFAGGLFASSSFLVAKLPLSLQRIYYTIAYKATAPDLRPASEFMKRAHEATKTKRSDYKTPYTFSYVAKDLDIVKRDSVRCQACHGSMLQQEYGKPKYPIHVKMLTAPLIVFNCTDCHKKVDLGKRIPAQATIRVDRTQCTKCHETDSGSPISKLTGAKPIGKVDVPETFLISNHGVDKVSGLIWVKSRHAKVAAKVGVKKCRRCHQRGSEFNFCDDCHGRGGVRALDD